MMEILVSGVRDLNSNSVPNMRHTPKKASPNINPLFFNLVMGLNF